MDGRCGHGFYAGLAALGMLVFAMLVLFAVLNRSSGEVAAPAPSDVPARVVPPPAHAETVGDAAAAPDGRSVARRGATAVSQGLTYIARPIDSGARHQIRGLGI